MSWTILLEKKSEVCLNLDIARQHLRRIASVATKNQRYRFRARLGKLADPIDIEDGRLKKRYLVKIRLDEETAKSPAVAQERFEHIRGLVEKRAAIYDWKIVEHEVAKPVVVIRDVELPTEIRIRSPFRPLQLTDAVIAERFADIYEREPHIRIINDAVQTHVITSGNVRAHTVLFGEPGGCKTSVLERLKTIYDDDVERMIFMDATTMSKAGFEKWILERGEEGNLPEILCIEEIEKVDNKDNLKCLGSIMASGYIMRTNANIGRRETKANFLVLATCNDEQALQGFMRGYIWDRFTNQEVCTLPSDEVMFKILNDKIRKIPGGNPAWARSAMNLAKIMGVRTPRKIIGFLAGRHRLEDGSYQRDKLSIARAGRIEKDTLKKTSQPV